MRRGTRFGGRLGRGPFLGRALSALAIVVILVGGIYLSTARSMGAPAQAPSFDGTFIVGNGSAIVEIGYLGFADVWTPASNGTQVYSQAFYMVFFNLKTTQGVNVQVTTYQNGQYVQNTSIYLPPYSQVATTITLPPNPAWVDTTFYFDGVALWSGMAATPISLLPNYITNIGGLDLIALTIVSFMILVTMGAVACARWAVKRAVWAPKFSLLIWGHVVLAIFAGSVFIFYQQIDQVFAGWSPLVYPFAIFPLAFTTSLSLFNRAPKVLVEQGVEMGGQLGYRLTDLRVGWLEDGRLVAVGESWGQFWARFWGHHAVLNDGKDDTPAPFLAPVETVPSPTDSAGRKRRIKRQAKGAYQTGPSRLTAFRVLNATDKGGYSYKAYAKGPPVVHYARLSIHRDKLYRARYAPSGVGNTPVLIRPEYTRRVLTWPHYIDPTQRSAIDLEDEHYEWAATVLAKFASVRDLGRVVSKMGSRLDMLEAAKHNAIQDEVYSKVRTIEYLEGRATSGVSEEDEGEIGKRLPSLLSSVNPKDVRS